MPARKKSKPEEPKQRLCPRCQGGMDEIVYQGVTLDQCLECWGIWLDTGELETILALREEHFGKEEREMVLQAIYGDVFLQLEEPPLPCPVCDKEMRKHRVTFIPDAALIIDTCHRDGVWMDAGELRAAEVLVDEADTMEFILRELKEA